MKEATKNYLRKIIAQVKDVSTHREAERTIEPKTPADKSLRSSLSTKHKQADHPAPYAVEKRKKHHIPFVALAVGLIFTSLYLLALLGQSPSTLAAVAHSSLATLHHSISSSLDATPDTSNCVETNTCYGAGEPAATPAPDSGVPPDDLVLGTDTNSCEIFHTYGDYHGHDNTLCWNEKDFDWGARDISCVVNPHLQEQINYFNTQHPEASLTGALTPIPADSSTSNTQTTQATPTTQNTSISNNFNQNTCVDGSTCYSTNTSFNDSPSSGIHAQVGGDDIICFNNACIVKATPNVANGNGDVCSGGMGLQFDKFACSHRNSSSSGNMWYFNPTAYNPRGFVEHTDGDFSASKGGAWGQTIDASHDWPLCDSSNHWSCPNNDTVVLLLDQALNAYPLEGQVSHPREYIGLGKSDGSDGPPNYIVTCDKLSTGWIFPCSDSKDHKINEGMIKTDWLSGEANRAGQESAGHLSLTYTGDTIDRVYPLFSIMMGFGYVLLAPVIILIGYQFLWASWTLGRANAMEAFGRVLLSLLAMAISYELCVMLIGLSNAFSHAGITLHAQLGYPQTKINNQNMEYTLEGEDDRTSFRGIVVPVTRWGCIMNDFMSILSHKLIADTVGSFLPFIGGAAKLATGIWDAIEVLHHLGDFLQLILSINLCTQIFVRIILINYYILTSPVIFACWALPSGTGSKVVGQWFKGFVTLLLVPGIQVFALTTMPWLTPDFPPLPGDKFGLLNVFFRVLPKIVVLMSTVQVPKVLGTGATKAMAQAGNMTAGAVVALGAAAYNIV